MINNDFAVILLLIIAAIGTIAYFGNFIKNIFSKTFAERIVKRVLDDDKFAIKITNSLDFCLCKKEIKDFSFKSRIEQIQKNQKLNKHIILSVKRITNDTYLFITHCKDIDYGITIGGAMGNIKKYYQFNYKLTFDIDKKVIKIYSNDYIKISNKLIMESFKVELINYLNI